MNGARIKTMPVINVIDYSNYGEEEIKDKPSRRMKGEGSIRKKGNSYEGRVTVKIQGKSKQISISDTDKKTLIKRMAEAVSKSDNYKHVGRDYTTVSQ